uniref:Uncharacterized protein n=1 Tax=Helianthus annuus TaxID=4232 RepID=A0A251SU27_HELAN
MTRRKVALILGGSDPSSSPCWVKVFGFAPPTEIQPRPLAANALDLRESITIGKTAPDSIISLPFDILL